MKELLNNGWVIGIGGGILSGLIVTWLTRTLFSKKDLRELAANISSANREILYAIKTRDFRTQLANSRDNRVTQKCYSKKIRLSQNACMELRK